jgi:single-strand DNA-binding protein
MSTYHNFDLSVRGNIGQDPEIKVLNEGTDNEFKIASFSLAVNLERWDSKNQEEVERTEWLDVAVFGGAANYIEQVAEKGDTISIDLVRHTDDWTDDDGNNRRSFEYRYNGGDMQILNGGGGGTTPAEQLDNESSGSGPSDRRSGGSSDGSSGDDLPF